MVRSILAQALGSSVKASGRPLPGRGSCLVPWSLRGDRVTIITSEVSREGKVASFD